MEDKTTVVQGPLAEQTAESSPDQGGFVNKLEAEIDKQYQSETDPYKKRELRYQSMVLDVAKEHHVMQVMGTDDLRVYNETPKEERDEIAGRMTKDDVADTIKTLRKDWDETNKWFEETYKGKFGFKRSKDDGYYYVSREVHGGFDDAAFVLLGRLEQETAPKPNKLFKNKK